MSKLLAGATKEQVEAIKHGTGPAFVSACPGAGKCVLGETLVETSKGTFPIADIPKHFDFDRKTNECRAEVLGLSTDKSNLRYTTTSHWFDFDETPTIEVVTDNGRRLVGTPEHKVVAAYCSTSSENYTYEFVRLDRIKTGSLVCLTTPTQKLYAERVVSVKPAGKRKVYDFTVPDGHSFVGNGFINHNTRVITHRCAHLLQKGVHPRNIVGITFTNKAANEMKSRVQSMVDSPLARKLWLSTFHSFCARLLRASPQTYQVHPAFGIADEADAKEHVVLAIAQIMGKTEKDVRSMDRSGDSVDVNHVRRWISRHKNATHTASDVQKIRKQLQYPDYVPYYIAYERLLKKNGLLDFDDLLLYVVLGLRQHERIRKFYSDNLHYLMVDEWQDTNTAQFEIVRRMCEGHHNLFVVGDLEQCLPGDTLISTPTGVTRIDQIKAGDEVLCGGGHGSAVEQKVDKVCKRPFEGELVEVTTTSGKTIRATPNHCIFAKLPENIQDARKIVTFRQFGTSRKHHEWFFHSSSEELLDYAVKAGLKPEVTHRKKKLRWRCREVLADHDKALKHAKEAADKLDAGLRLKTKLYTGKSGIYDFIPVGNAFAGMRVPVVDNGKIVEEDVVEVKRSQYKGNVYDLSVPEYRNYCANSVVVHNSIYKFRGASPENTDKFYKHFPETKTYLLTKNFRSLPGIASVANTVISNNDRRHAKDIVTHKSGGVKPKCLSFQSPDDEAHYIASTISGLVKQKKYQWQDFAIIYRIRSLSRALEDALVYQNIPYRVIGANTFYNRAAIKDLLAYLRLVAQPHDNAAYTRIHNKPTRGIGAVNFQRFATVADQEGMSLLQAHLKGKYKDVVQPSSLHGFRSLKKLFSMARRMDQDKVAPVMRHIISYSNYAGYVEKIKDPERRQRVMDDIRELVNATQYFDEKSKKKGVTAYLDHVMLMQRDDKDRDDNVATLMTAHASKGTEFKNVFLVGCAENVLPLPPRNEAGGPLNNAEMVREHYEEERRVFYVAVTRAEENLWVTWPEQRIFNGNIGQQEPSQFILEAGDTMEHLQLGGGYNMNYRQRKYVRPKPSPKKKTAQKTGVKRRSSKSNIAKDGGVQDIIEMKKSQNGEAWELELKRRRASRERGK